MTKFETRLAPGDLCVIKFGSAVLTTDGLGVDANTAMPGWVSDIAVLRQRQVQVVLVSSGAVAEGLRRLGWNARPEKLHELQAAAAMGQMGLVQAWESRFAEFGLRTAQVLLTHGDLADRTRYLNARTTLLTLVKAGAVPIVNENDVVASEELRFGDNDTLAGLVANLLGARLLMLLTDQPGMLRADPKVDPDAELIEFAEVSDPSLDKAAGGGDSRLGRGGMKSKLNAARLAARSGTDTVIADGRAPGVIQQIASGASCGSRLRADRGVLAARKRWLVGGLRVAGKLTIDAGAVKGLRQSGRSLLAVGVLSSEGRYQRGDLVSCADESGVEVARGLVNYSAEEVAVIAGQPTTRFADLLGCAREDELIHRDNLVVV